MRVICWIIFITFFSLQSFAQQVNMSGIWTGKLALPNSLELAIVFNLSKDDSGKYTSTLDSPDQGAMAVSYTHLTLPTSDLV